MCVCVCVCVCVLLCRIFQFENFSQTKKRVLTREDDEAALVSG